MRARSLFAYGLLVLLAMGLARCAQPAEQPAGTPADTLAATAPSAGDENDPQAVAQQVLAFQQHLRKARRNLRDRNRQEGSLQLGEVAGLLSKRLAQASDLSKEDLEYSAGEFSGMAERIFRTPAIPMTEMDGALTRVFWALAKDHFQKATERWGLGQAPQAAAHLKATATFIDEAIGYYSGGLEEQSENLVAELQDLARQLNTGAAKRDEAAVTAQLQDIGKKIRDYSTQVRRAIDLYVVT